MKTPSFLRKTGHLLTESFHEFISDNGLKLSAALSYYTIFSLPPLLIIIISLCGIFFGDHAVKGEIFQQINGLVGASAAMQIQEIIKNVKLSKQQYILHGYWHHRINNRRIRRLCRNSGLCKLYMGHKSKAKTRLNKIYH